MVGAKGQPKRWGWVLGAVIAIFVAVAMTSRVAPHFSIFGRSNKPCQCAQVNHLPTSFLCICLFITAKMEDPHFPFSLYFFVLLGKMNVLKLGFLFL